jgi:ferric-dicitrate binding protein FerR (iron transport regulator)
MKLPEEDELLHELYENQEFCKLLARAEFVQLDEWEQWFAERLEYRSVSYLARTLYELQYFEQSVFDTGAYASEVWSAVDDFVEYSDSPVSRPSFLKWIVSSWIPYAAMIFAILSLWFNMPLDHKSVDTIAIVSATDQRSVLLPDGSRVILNKDSQIKYREDEQGRHLELVGEAYLHVAKKLKDKVRVPFTVKGDGFEVKVLGTRFNMINTKYVKLIALDEGRVSVNQSDKKVIMAPGQVVKSEGNELKLVPIKAALMNAWHTGLLQLNNTSLNEIISWLEITQGVHIVNNLPQEIQGLTMSGQIDVRDQENLYRSISSIYNIEIVKEKDQIILKKNNQ